MALQDGTYIITSALNGNPVLDLSGGNDPISNIIAFHKHGGKNQQWKVTRLRREEYSLQSVYGGTWITAPTDGSNSQLDSSRYDPIPANRETRWRIVQANNGYTIYSVLEPTKAIDVSGGNTKDLTPILLWPFHGGPNQVFNFTKV